MDAMLTLVTSSLASAASAASADFFWDHPLFKKETWEGITNFIRFALTFGGALWFIYVWRAWRMGERVPRRTQKRVAYLLTIVAFGVYFDFFNPHSRYSEYYHRHEFYHYYLGSKYFKEVGYKRLYECTAIAEVELGRRQAVANREIRDLRVNLIKPVKDTYILTDPGQCKDHFATERWEAFKRDVSWFQSVAAGSYWENMQKDHGYNPPPVWTMAGKFFGSFAPAGDTYFKILAGIDVLLHVLIIAMIRWAFGWRVMTVAAVFWGTNAAANFYWTGGAFLRQDWLFLLVASVCLARKRYFALAGAALTWSALLRVFPAALFAGWGVMIGLQLLKRARFDALQGKAQATGKGRKGKGREPPAWLLPEHRRLLAGCVIAVGVLVPASMAVAGTGSYKAFFEHTLSTHLNTPLTNEMGLKAMLTHTWEGRMRFSRDDNLDDPFQKWKEGRLERAKKMRPVQLAIGLGLGLSLIWGLRRSKLLWVAVPLSLPFVPALTNLTCYYYSMFMVAAVLSRNRPPLAPVMMIVAGASQILYIYPGPGFYWIDDRFTSIAWLFFLLAILIHYSYNRPFSMERLKAWWNGLPEPKDRSKAGGKGEGGPASKLVSEGEG
jgi:hypothetical protein